MSDGGKGRQKSDNLRADDFADWDEGKLSTNK